MAVRPSRARGPRGTAWWLATGALIGCASGGGSASFPSVGSPPAGVAMTMSVVEYPVTSPTIRELNAELRRAGPELEGRRFAGVTRVQTRWSYLYDRQGIACALKDVRVRLEVRVELPRWDGAAAADSGVVRWWEGFRTRLAEHERDHVKIALEESGGIVNALRRLSGGSCDALGILANNTAQALLVRTQARQDALDRDTRHGTLARPPAPPPARSR